MQAQRAGEAAAVGLHPTQPRCCRLLWLTGEILAGCREADPPPHCDLSAANGSIVLGGLGALCRSGTSLAPTAPWSY